MAVSTLSPLLPLLLLLSLSLFIRADILPSVPVSPIAACNSTPDPTFCKSILPPTAGPQNLYSYSRFSLAKSLSNANNFLALVDLYLALSTTFSVPAVRALQDCQLLSGLNIDFLTSASETVNSTTVLLDSQTDEVQTLLSALLTNQQTCLDGLQATASAWSLKSGLLAPLTDGTKFYRVALSFFNRAWVPNKKRNPLKGFRPPRIPKGKKLKSPRKGRSLLPHEVEMSGLPLHMSMRNRELFERTSGRRLLQASDTVLVSNVVVVSQDGSGNFTTINDALATATNNSKVFNGYFLIYVKAGVYEEYVSIPKTKRYVMMIGDGIGQTVITGNHSNVDGWTTFNSATLAVVGQGFAAINITIENTSGAIKHQAVALRNGADLSTFYSCSFEGYQDTLYTHSMRQFYRECNIYGTVDFVFGNAAVVFQSCNIYSRLPMSEQKNTITAQGRTDPNQNTGIVMQGCNLVASPELASDNGSTVTYLGRPWKLYSRTIIMQSFMDTLIDPSGWLPWDGDFALSTLYYSEYNNTGPGSSTSNRVTWAGIHNDINSTDAGNFTVSSFVFGDIWLPQTGVPYSTGLL